MRREGGWVGWHVATAPRAPAWDLRIHNHAYVILRMVELCMYEYFQMRRLLQQNTVYPCSLPLSSCFTMSKNVLQYVKAMWKVRKIFKFFACFQRLLHWLLLMFRLNAPIAALFALMTTGAFSRNIGKLYFPSSNWYRYYLPLHFAY